MATLLVLSAESVGNLGFSAGLVYPFPDSAVIWARGPGVKAGPSFAADVFINTTFSQALGLFFSYGLSGGFRYYEFQGPWGLARFYQWPLLVSLKGFPGWRFRPSLGLVAGVAYSASRWVPPLADSTQSLRGWARCLGLEASADFELRQFLWLGAGARFLFYSQPVPAEGFKGVDGTVDLAPRERVFSLKIYWGN